MIENKHSSMAYSKRDLGQISLEIWKFEKLIFATCQRPLIKLALLKFVPWSWLLWAYKYELLTSSNIDWNLAMDTDDLCRSFSDFLITSGPDVEVVLTLVCFSDVAWTALLLPNDWESGDFTDSEGDSGEGDTVSETFVPLTFRSPFASDFGGLAVTSCFTVFLCVTAIFFSETEWSFPISYYPIKKLPTSKSNKTYKL